MNTSKGFTKVLLVGVDVKDGDIATLVVGVKQPNEAVDIINAFQGEEALTLYNKLITPIEPVK